MSMRTTTNKGLTEMVETAVKALCIHSVINIGVSEPFDRTCKGMISHPDGTPYREVKITLGQGNPRFIDDLHTKAVEGMLRYWLGENEIYVQPSCVRGEIILYSYKNFDFGRM